MHYGLDTSLIRIGAIPFPDLFVSAMRSRYLHPGDAPQGERMAPTGFQEELKARILAYLDDLNRTPVIHTWTHCCPVRWTEFA
jgi:hypothetical protein